jgi:ABC-type bacteriocin/lantibiotic exporter with double-glycine peptidase domain
MSSPKHASSLLKEVLFTRPWIRISMLLLSLFSAGFGILGPFFQKEFVDKLTGQEQILNLDWHPLFFLGLSFLS